MAADPQEALGRFVSCCAIEAEAIRAQAREIYRETLVRSRWLDAGNFTRAHPEDLSRLFDLYDQQFFGGTLRPALGDRPLRFRLSRRMTSAGGKTVRFERRPVLGGVERRYEIVVSATLLFQTFRDRDEPVSVTGTLCHDRLEALQRIFEHELVHLTEMLVWYDSSCTARRFRSIANRMFGHTQHTHELISPAEHAQKTYGVHPGDRVTFRVDGRQYFGVVNRITRRATVLVEDPRGAPYTDGRRYRKYYVPVPLLQRREEP